MSTDHDLRARRLEKKLAELATKDFLPREIVTLVGEVARRQLAAQACAAVALPAAADLPDALAASQGKPLIERGRFPFDATQAELLFGEFAELLAGLGGEQAKAVAAVRAALASGEITLAEAFARHLAGDDAFFALFAGRTPAAPRTLGFLVQAALTPSLAAAADAFRAEIEKADARQHGHCPVCGSLPLFSVLREKEGLRFAVCSFCQAEYRIRRLSCPYCDEADPAKLTFFTADELPGFRVDVCAACRRYVKAADFRALDKVSVPVLDDLESLALDILAREAGFERPVLSAWGF
jgi:FdhE protein